MQRANSLRPQAVTFSVPAVFVGIAVFTAMVLSTAAQAQSPAQESPAAQRGATFVRTHCAECHSIDKVSPSPLAIAPPLRDLHKKYPVENLEEAFAEGIVTGHPTMPQFHLDPAQIGDVIAYLKWLEN